MNGSTSSKTQLIPGSVFPHVVFSAALKPGCHTPDSSQVIQLSISLVIPGFPFIALLTQVRWAHLVPQPGLQHRKYCSLPLITQVEMHGDREKAAAVPSPFCPRWPSVSETETWVLNTICCVLQEPGAFWASLTPFQPVCPAYWEPFASFVEPQDVRHCRSSQKEGLSCRKGQLHIYFRPSSPGSASASARWWAHVWESKCTLPWEWSTL